MRSPRCGSDNSDGTRFCINGTINQDAGGGVMARFGALEADYRMQGVRYRLQDQHIGLATMSCLAPIVSLQH
jgi:hypothetical protein